MLQQPCKDYETAILTYLYAFCKNWQDSCHHISGKQHWLNYTTFLNTKTKIICCIFQYRWYLSALIQICQYCMATSLVLLLSKTIQKIVKVKIPPKPQNPWKFFPLTINSVNYAYEIGGLMKYLQYTLKQISNWEDALFNFVFKCTNPTQSHITCLWRTSIFCSIIMYACRLR